MADDLAMVERIYEVGGMPMTSEARSEISHHLDAHQRGQHGRVVYDLRADFGAEPAEIRAGFEFYLDRFAVEIEVGA